MIINYQAYLFNLKLNTVKHLSKMKENQIV